MARNKIVGLVLVLAVLVAGSSYGAYRHGKKVGHSQGYEWGVKKGRIDEARKRPPEPIDRGYSGSELAGSEAVLALQLEEGELDALAALMNLAPSPCRRDAKRGVSLATALADPDKSCPSFAVSQARLALAALRTFDDAAEALAVLRVERRANLRVDERPTRGNPASEVVLVEWADFQCPYCVRSLDLVEGLLARRDDVRVVFKHFPLSFHAAALPAALAVEAAREQGRFWEMHDALFALGKGVGKGIDKEDPVPETGPVPFEQIAEDLGLDAGRFRQDYRSEAVRDRVEEDREEGLSVGVRGTPSFYIDGRRVVERPSVENLSLLVDKALSERQGRFSWDLPTAP